MATLTVSGNNASYKLSLSGMSTSTRYHVFVADLSSSGTVTGYKCVRSSLGTSSTWTYSGSSNSPYSNYSRSVYAYTSTAATSHSVGTIYTYDEMRNGCTFMDSDTIPAAGSSGYDTNALYFRAGDGVKSFKMRYDSATDTGVISGSIGSTTVGLFVRDGTNASLSTAVYEDGYKSPWQFIEYTNSKYTTVKKYFTENDGDVYSSGTRYVELTATKSDTYWYQMHADANGGTFSGGSTLWSSAVLSVSGTGGSVSYALSNFPTPTRSGYTFVGWGPSKTLTTTYDSAVNFTTTATSSDDPRSVTVYAVWAKTEYVAYVKLGDGITSANVLVNSAQKAYITDSAYHAISITNGDTLTISGIGKQTSYGLPYLLTYYASATTTTPIRTAEYNTTSVSFTWAAGNLWLVLSATKTTIDLFYWVNEASDDTLIAKGEPVKNITAARWNSLKAKIKELADAQGISYTYSNVSSGSTFSATEFNAVRNVIDKFDGAGALPPIKNSGDQILASFFNGTASLKSALNRAITTYNNS